MKKPCEIWNKQTNIKMKTKTILFLFLANILFLGLKAQSPSTQYFTYGNDYSKFNFSVSCLTTDYQLSNISTGKTVNIALKIYSKDYIKNRIIEVFAQNLYGNALNYPYQGFVNYGRNIYVQIPIKQNINIAGNRGTIKLNFRDPHSKRLIDLPIRLNYTISPTYEGEELISKKLKINTAQKEKKTIVYTITESKTQKYTFYKDGKEFGRTPQESKQGKTTILTYSNLPDSEYHLVAENRKGEKTTSETIVLGLKREEAKDEAVEEEKQDTLTQPEIEKEESVEDETGAENEQTNNSGSSTTVILILLMIVGMVIFLIANNKKRT